jgi:uncharacterized protein YeaO (DUF488 family)
MKPALKLRTFQLATPPKRGEGLRICVARRPVRGVPLDRLRQDGCFDSWLPSLAPSLELLSRTPIQRLHEPLLRKRFFAAYEREMKASGPRHTIAFLATLSRTTAISIGCYCSDESHCHRSRLRDLIERAASADLL